MQAYPSKERCYSVEEDFKIEKDFKLSKDKIHHSKGPSHHDGDFKIKEEFKSNMHISPSHDRYNGHHGHHGGYGGGHHGLEKYHHGGYGGGHHDDYGSHSESWSFEKEKHLDGYPSHGGRYGGYGGIGHHKVGGGGYGPQGHVEEYRYYSEQIKGRPVWESRAIKD